MHDLTTTSHKTPDDSRELPGRPPRRLPNWTHLPSPSPRRVRYPADELYQSPNMSPVLRNALVRASRQSATTALGYRAASTHAISNPTLANIEKRWEGMPMQEQAELWMALRDRMKESWADLTVQEKKAGKLPMPSIHPRGRFINSGSIPRASRSLEGAPRREVGWIAMVWRSPIDG